MGKKKSGVPYQSKVGKKKSGDPYQAEVGLKKDKRGQMLPFSIKKNTEMLNMIKRELKLVRISEKYVKFLSEVDNRVPYNSKNKKGRPFIGILFDIENIHYFAPLSSPKEKHKHMPNNIDFLKISAGKYGVINFNNMIPVPKKEIFEIEINNTIIKDKEYLLLLENQIRWCLDNNKKIKKHAIKLRKRRLINKLPNKIINRCCDFRLLEKQLEKYL